MQKPLFFTLLILILISLSAQAIDEIDISQKLHTVYGLYLTPHEAYNIKKHQGDNILLIDIRTRPELKYIGSTQLIDANIPSRFINTEFTWSDKASTYRTLKNKHFVEDFEKLLRLKNKTKKTPVILMCQSGSRAPLAAKKLHEAGFDKVYSLYQGFEGIKAKSGINQGKRLINGWKNSGLPWEFTLKKEAMYFNFDSTKAK